MIEGGVWRHYKGGIYRVICRARDANDGTPMTVYQDIGTGRIYTRPEAEWVETVPGIGARFARLDPTK
jgi:hypothetical protein